MQRRDNSRQELGQTGQVKTLPTTRSIFLYWNDKSTLTWSWTVARRCKSYRGLTQYSWKFRFSPSVPIVPSTDTFKIRSSSFAADDDDPSPIPRACDRNLELTVNHHGVHQERILYSTLPRSCCTSSRTELLTKGGGILCKKGLTKTAIDYCTFLRIPFPTTRTSIFFTLTWGWCILSRITRLSVGQFWSFHG